MMSQTNEGNQATQPNRPPQQASSRSIFTVPTPIKQLFDRFPLSTYSINELPQRAPRNRDAHVLYVFASDTQALKGAPSYNPACLKWQVRAVHDVRQPPTYSISGLPQILQHTIPLSSSEQPRLTKRRTSVSDPCVARAIQTHTASAVWEAAKMDDQQRQEGDR
jgi:hypothetical protein